MCVRAYTYVCVRECVVCVPLYVCVCVCVCVCACVRVRAVCVCVREREGAVQNEVSVTLAPRTVRVSKC